MSKKSLSCALSGIACAARKGRNLRIMFACAALVVLISFLLRLSGTEWAIVLMCCGGVIALEMVNTALEYIVMDGGSTDNSVDVIKRYADHLAYWQSQPDGGQAAAINAAISRAVHGVLG